MTLVAQAHKLDEIMTRLVAQVSTVSHGHVMLLIDSPNEIYCFNVFHGFHMFSYVFRYVFINIIQLMSWMSIPAHG